MIYAICSTNRTGSSLLCELLMNSGLAGYPADFTNALHLEHFLPDCKAHRPMTKKSMVELIGKYSANGIFGIKLPYASYKKEIERSTLLNLFPETPKFIYITREDKLKQAISALKAVGERKYYSFQEVENKTKESYSKKNIDFYLNNIKDQESEWERYFSRTNSNPLRISYEELETDQTNTLTKVLEFLDVNVTKFVPSKTKLKKQSNDVNLEWEKKYKSEQ